jgi:hypothetical protein
MWFNNQYFKSDPEKGGRIVIPYEKNENSGKCILINDGFAQLTEFRRRSENYSFDVAYIVNHESLLMGKEAEIILKPTLKVNDRKCNLNVLKNTKVTLTTVSFVDNMPVTKTFDNLSVSSDEDISVKFQVPPNLQSVSVNIETEVRNISKSTTEKLYHSHNINMSTQNSGLSFYESYLRKQKDDYYFYLLGKNGEPLFDAPVVFTFDHRIYSHISKSVTLNTDEDGKVNLGPLKDIRNVSTNFNGPNGTVSHYYTLQEFTENVCLPGNLNILEDESVSLPFISSQEFSKDTVELIRYSSSHKVIENCFDKISFSHEEGYQYGKITISGLERGHYQLNFLTRFSPVQIRVHKGVYWETDSFILKDHCLVEKRDRNNIIRIKNVNLEEQKENHKLSFTLEDYGKHARAHVYAFTFMPNDNLSDFQSISDVSRDYSSLDIFPFAKWKNIFLSNRKLGDEFRYVFDRKFVKRFMGNTLDRPQLLLNRHKIRDTNYDQEVVHSGTAYQREAEEVKDYQMLQQNIAPMASMNRAPMMQQQRNFARNDLRSNMIQMQNIAPQAYAMNNCADYMQQECSNIGSYGGRGYGGSDGDPKSFLNFLNNSALVMPNLVPNEDGLIECEFNAYKYSTIMILALDDNTVTQSVVDVASSQSELEKRDLSLSQPLDPEKYYNEMRNTVLLRKGESHVIEDITSTDYLLVDSLEKVHQVQGEVQKATGHYSDKDLDFLISWHTLSKEEKHKKYSRFMCHEVNLYLYFKDHDYFEEVVKPFLVNKMEKTFIDHWLLQDIEDPKKYASIDMLANLNTLEKCLLISLLANSSPEDAEGLWKNIQIRSEMNDKRVEQKNKVFDTVINLNMTQDQLKDMEK